MLPFRHSSCAHICTGINDNARLSVLNGCSICTDLLTQGKKNPKALRQRCQMCSFPPDRYQPLSLCRTWEKCLFWRKKLDWISCFHLLTQLPRSCKTGYSIVNYLKTQSQHIFSPCSPCSELSDPQTYRPLSVGKKDQLFAPNPATAHGPDERTE